ncbi:hypothetical protein ING2D1G_0623 [Peptoniphilus sp. ING2-D1G]|nr:hypothetical protein ING2D1G_0623 [Peptoniphilus sp. ING2-D1G]
MIIVDKKIDDEILNNLKNLDDILFTTENNNLPSPVNTHPDMLIRALEDNDLIVDKDNYQYYKSSLFGYDVMKSESSLKGKYPEDISLNFCKFKNYIIHNLKYTDKKILKYYKDRNFNFIDVKQGYTKCNIVVGKNSLITSDTDIYNKLNRIFNILLIEHKQIILDGYNYGFIGGCSGLINGTLYFTGDIKSHSDGQRIKEFLKLNNEKYGILSNGNLKDYGSILQI